jgi:3,4-dihydroxy 2-butanone 4-phosphate synthase/GTP cyclohydrolase II
MFTGLIEFVSEYILNENKILFKQNDFWNECCLGDSIAVNGICLTISVISNEHITFDLLDETISITNIKKCKFANLEKAMVYGKRLGGHTISGHIYEIGVIQEINDNIFVVNIKNEYHLKIKDSITINGVSLTIQKIKNNSFEVHIIPITFENTTFKFLKIGDEVNIEYNIDYSDEYFMEIALKESNKGRESVSPNPWVGCVIVDNNQIVATGYHHHFGACHAEIDALNKSTGNTMYVTLEPCCHHGKTGPCCEVIVSSGIKKVVIGVLDPDPKVSGKGVEFLQNKGIEVIIGVLEESIKENLRSYIHSRKTGFPYVIAKIALSQEGNYCIENENVTITSSETQCSYHTLRAESDCIIIGSKTALIDNPRLTNRMSEKQPLRVIIDSKGIVKSSNLMCSGTLIITSEAPTETVEYWKSFGVEVVFMEINPRDILKFLGKRGALQVLIEGGGELQKVFEDYIDEIVVVKSQTQLPQGKPWTIDQSKFQEGRRILTNINYALETFKKGMVIVMDDATRENEGDLIVNAEVVTEEMITFIKRYTTGIICVTLTEQRALELGLNTMVVNNSDPHKTAFTITCDSTECSTGVSSKDRLLTIKTLLSGNEDQLSKPGHIFPLIAKAGGLSERRGHTEASIDLCKLIGCTPVAVICELTNDNGTMMKLNDILQFSKKFGIPVITTEQIYQTSKNVKNRFEKPINLTASCELTTREYGKWTLQSFDCVYGTIKVLQIDGGNKPFVRIHSECFTGDVLNSSHCDCGNQLKLSMEMIYKNGCGIIIYPCNHEGRGIGFTNKIKAYDLMNKNISIDTYQANKVLGFKEDLRDYSYCVSVLKYLNIDNFILLTTNPNKINAVSQFHFETLALECGNLPFNERYLTTKAKKHGIFKLKKIAIIKSMWYSESINGYVDQLCKQLNIEKIIAVPGCFEIPLTIQNNINDFDIFIAVGAIIKGETYHFEVISHTITDALMNIQLKYEKRIINNILNCYTIEQVIERFSNPQSIIDTVKFLI